MNQEAALWAAASNNSITIWVAVIAASAALGGALVGVLVKLLNRDVDRAAATASRSASRKDDVSVLREIIDELRDSETRKTERIDKLEERMAKLEERERHALTRAAVHEAWDQMTFALIVANHPGHPPPPPIRDTSALPPGDDGHPAT